MNSVTWAAAFFENRMARPCPINARIFQMLNNEKCLHISKKSRTFVGTKINNITNQKSHIMETKLSKRELIALVRNTVRTADLTTICRLYYESTGKRPSFYRTATGLYQEERELDTLALNCWASEYGCTAHEIRRLKWLEWDNERYTRRQSLSPRYKYGRHGFYKPTPKHEAMEILRSYKLDPRSPYAKRLTKGCSNLYAASPYYGLEDYNKSMIMPMAGHEAFIDKIVGYCDKIQERTQNNQN